MFYKLQELYIWSKQYLQDKFRPKTITIEVGPITLSANLSITEKKYYNMLTAFNLLSLENGVTNENNCSSYIVLCTHKGNITKLSDIIEPESPYYILEEYSDKTNLDKHLKTSLALKNFREFKKQNADFNDMNCPIKIPQAKEGVSKTISQFISELKEVK